MKKILGQANDENIRRTGIRQLLMAAVLCGSILTMAITAQVALAQGARGIENLPYTPIDNPQFVHASQATFLQPGNILLGVAEGGVAKAYPAAILAQHGVVEDRMPNAPIVVTWCAYCNTAVVFRDEVKGRTLHFYTVGVIGSSEVFKDRETGSKWQQAALISISGPLKGTQLKLYPFLLTTWSNWRKQHPDTLVLKPLPGYAKRLAAKNQIIDQGIVGMSGPAPFGVVRDDQRLSPRSTVVGLELGGVAKAYSIAALQKTRVVNDRIGNAHIVVIHQPASDTTTAFLATLGGRTIRFRAVNAAADRLTDLGTHSTWNAYGVCLSGPLKGTHLKELILEPSFWFAWSEFHPGTELYAGPRTSRSNRT